MELNWFNNKMILKSHVHIVHQIQPKYKSNAVVVAAERGFCVMCVDISICIVLFLYNPANYFMIGVF